MFEKFTETALHAIMSAQDESRRLNHNFVGTEQILLGLLCPNLSSASILNSQGLSIENTRNEVEKIIGKGSGTDIEIPFTDNAKKLLKNAGLEACKLNQPITELHLLLALTYTQGKHLEIFKTFNIDIDKIKTNIEEKIGKLAVKVNNKFITACYLLLIIMLFIFSFVLLSDLISSLTLTRSSVIAMFELIVIAFLVRNDIPFRFRYGIIYNLCEFIRITCLIVAVLFIVILLVSFTIWIMIIIGKYRYSA